MFLKPLNDDDIGFLIRVAGLAPFQFFGQPTVEKDLSQFLGFCLPTFGPRYKGINLGISFLDRHGLELELRRHSCRRKWFEVLDPNLVVQWVLVVEAPSIDIIESCHNHEPFVD